MACSEVNPMTEVSVIQQLSYGVFALRDPHNAEKGPPVAASGPLFKALKGLNDDGEF